MDRRFLIAGGAILFLILVWIVLPKGKAPQSLDAQASSPSPSSKEIYAQAVHYRKNHDLIKTKVLKL